MNKKAKIKLRPVKKTKKGKLDKQSYRKYKPSDLFY